MSMEKITNHTKSVWSNGLKKDSEGYSVFYPLGTNKVNVSDITWPSGDKLMSPFVYENEKLVALCDTKSLEGDTFNVPYNDITMEIDGNPITINLEDSCDKFKVTLTKATVGPVIKKSGEEETSADYDLMAPELTSAVGMFSNRKIKSIKLYIPKLTDGTDMFKDCELSSEAIYEILNSIPKGTGENSINVGKIPQDITEEELVNAFAEKGWNISSITYIDITGGSEIRYFTELNDEQKDVLSRTVKIINNECYDENDAKIANFDTNKIKDLTNVLKINSLDFDNETFDITFSEGDKDYTLDLNLDKLTHFDSDLSNLVNGSNLFNESNLISFKGDLSKLKHQIVDVGTVNLPDDIDALSKFMFEEMLNFRMFGRCENFVSNIPLLENGNEMFRNTIRDFKGNLISLRSGKGMFGISRRYAKVVCNYLYELIKDIEYFPINSYLDFLNLITEDYNIQENLSISEKEYIVGASFMSDIESGVGINTESFLNIINSIKDISKDETIVPDEKTGVGYIDIDCDFTKDYFESETNMTWEDTLNILESKGWKYLVRTISFISENETLEIEFYRNYEIIEEEEIIDGLSYKDIPQEKLAEVELTTEINNNKCYIDGKLIEDFDLSEIAVSNSFEASVGDYEMFYIPKCETLDLIKETNGNSGFLLFLLFSMVEGFLKIKNSKDYDFISFLSLTEDNPEMLSLFDSLHMNFPLIKNVTNSSLDKLINGNCLFMRSDIENFDCDMENLVEGAAMFYDSSLINFKGNLSKLKIHHAGQIGMFSKCSNLSSFDGKLSSLRNGYTMFLNCTKLSSFKSDLSSLEIGLLMFSKDNKHSILNVESIDNIADTIKDMSSVGDRHKEILLAHSSYADDDGNVFSSAFELGTLDVGLGFNPSEYNGKYGTWDNLKAAFSAKKWKVNFHFRDGSSESTTYGLRNRNNIIYAKLEEVHPNTKCLSKAEFDKKVDESDCPERYKEKIKNKFKNIPEVKCKCMPHHNYTSQDGTRYYNLVHFQDSNVDYSNYDQFTSLEEAIEYYDIKPVVESSNLEEMKAKMKM